MRELLLAGADVNAVDDEGRTALYIAAGRAGDAGVVRALLSAGADVTLRRCEGSLSALDQATKVGCRGALEAMIEYGVDVNAACSEGWTSLHFCLCHSRPNVVAFDMLVKAGADIDARDAHGFTPLHLAVYLKEMGVLMQMLKRWGADIDVLDDHGRSALQVAAALCDFPLAVSMTQALLDAGARVGGRNRDGRSALDIAAMAGNVGVLSVMIEHDADVTAATTKPPGLTAIHYAGACDNPKAIDVLVEAGADITATKNHTNCLHIAAGSLNVAVVQAILRHAGASDDLERMQLPTALAFVVTKAGKETKPAAAVVDLLLRWGAHESCVSARTRRLIGKGVPQDLARQEDAKRVRELLKNAPKDRAWRRRGFFVMCRAFPCRAQLNHGSGLPQDDTPPRSCTRPRLAAKDAAGEIEWAGVAGRLLWLDDGVFRAILEYV